MATLKRFNSEMDYGMQMADDALQELEKRINRVYRDAAEELSENLFSYMEQYAIADAKMREKLENNLISEDEYTKWRFNKIMRTQQMSAQVEKLTNDMVNTDKLAIAMINNDLPGVYCNGYNFAGFKGELMAQAAGYNYASFSIYNTEAMRIILTEDPDLIPWQPPEVNIPADKAWNRKHIQNAIAQGILQGDSIPNISKRLLPIVNMDKNAATRTARTAYTAVQNEGRRDATKKIQDAGIPMQEPWMALMADNTRDTHLMLHGTLPNEKGLYGEGIIPTGNLLRFPADPKGDPEQIYNCRCRVNSFLPGIDHSRDDELYEKMMREEFYNDWVGDKDATGVMEYKVDEQRRALERKKKLDSGEIESREAEAYRKAQEAKNNTTATIPEPLPISEITSQPINNKQPGNTQQSEPPKWRVAQNRQDAVDILKNDLGFKSVSDDFINNLDEELLCNNVNRLSELNNIFGKLTDGMDLEYRPATFVAEVQQHLLRGPEKLTFSKQYYTKNKEKIISETMSTMASKWSMPISEDYYQTYGVTHEYGHIFASRYIIGSEEYKKTVFVQFGDWQASGTYKKLAEKMRTDIEDIARNELNAYEIDIFYGISDYGKKNDDEFFAECFANAMCGDPNIMGQATRIFLERQGYKL